MNQMTLLAVIRSYYLAVMWLLTLVATACASTTAAPCYSTTDCRQDERCVQGSCFPTSCARGACNESQVCVADSCISKLCVNIRCPEGQGCAAGECYPSQCGGSVCRSGEVCDDAVCVDADCVGVVCSPDSVCANGQCLSRECGAELCAQDSVCRDGKCVSTVCLDVECKAEFACAQGNCLPTSCTSGPCAPGLQCVNDSCVDASCAANTCASDSVCLQSTCYLRRKIVFFTGVEPDEIQPTWLNTAAYQQYVSGYCCGLTGPELFVATMGGHSGSRVLLYSGTADDESRSYAYMRVFDVNIAVTSLTELSYWIFPEQSSGAHVSVDLLFTDGTNLRDSLSVDQHGVRMHPSQQGAGGHLIVGQWNYVASNIGKHNAGKVINEIWVGYQQLSEASSYRGFVDDLSLVEVR
jgi:hypothetical protein